MTEDRRDFSSDAFFFIRLIDSICSTRLDQQTTTDLFLTNKQSSTKYIFFSSRCFNRDDRQAIRLSSSLSSLSLSSKMKKKRRNNFIDNPRIVDNQMNKFSLVRTDKRKISLKYVTTDQKGF